MGESLNHPKGNTLPKRKHKRKTKYMQIWRCISNPITGPCKTQDECFSHLLPRISSLLRLHQQPPHAAPLEGSPFKRINHYKLSILASILLDSFLQHTCCHVKICDIRNEISALTFCNDFPN